MSVQTGDGNFLWAIGGKLEYGNTVNDTTVYNIDEDRWFSSVNGELSPMPHAVQGAAWTLYEDKIYCFGGKTEWRSGCTDCVQVYDIKNDTWRLLQNMPKARSKLGKFYPVVNDHYVFLFGGDCIEGTYSRVNWNWVFDLKNEKWDPGVADAPHAQSFPAPSYYDGWLYYITGNTGQSFWNSYPGALNQRYSPGKDTWEVMKPCPVPVTDGEGDSFNDEFHFLGGWNANPCFYNRFRPGYLGKVKKQHLIYSYKDDSWRTEKELPGSWHHGGARAGAGYLWRYLGAVDEDVSIKTNILKFFPNAERPKFLQHTNKIFRWDGEKWQTMSPAPVRKMNFGTIYSTVGPCSR